MLCGQRPVFAVPALETKRRVTREAVGQLEYARHSCSQHRPELCIRAKSVDHTHGGELGSNESCWDMHGGNAVERVRLQAKGKSCAANDTTAGTVVRACNASTFCG